MDDLNSMIKKTKLFSDKEKIELLTYVGGLSEEVKNELYKSIKDYDESIASLQNQFRNDMHNELDLIAKDNMDSEEISNAITQYKRGLNKILPDGN